MTHPGAHHTPSPPHSPDPQQGHGDTVTETDTNLSVAFCHRVTLSRPPPNPTTALTHRHGATSHQARRRTAPHQPITHAPEGAT